MARQKWTLVLILIGLPILATVITAFRVRDLPKSVQDDPNENRHKCVDCENDKAGRHSVKRNEELKKAVRAKQEAINKKVTEYKPSFRFVVDDDDDDDDDDDEDDDLVVLRSASIKKESQLYKSASAKKLITVKTLNDSEDDDDDDEDDDEDKNKSAKIKKESNIRDDKSNDNLIKKTNENLKKDVEDSKNLKSQTMSTKQGNENKDGKGKKKNVTKELKVVKTIKEQKDDLDDGDHNNDNIINIKKLNKIEDQKKEDSKYKLKPKENKSKKAMNNDDHTDDDDDDNVYSDGNDVDKVLITKAKGSQQSSASAEKLSSAKSVTNQPDQTKPSLKITTDQSIKKSNALEKPELKKDIKVSKVENMSKDSPKKMKEPEPIKLQEKKVKKSQEEYERNEKKRDSKENTEKEKIKLKKPDKDHSKDKSSSVEKLYDSQEHFGKGENRLKNVNDALHRRNLLQSEFEDFYAFFPTFAPNFSRIHNPECRRHGQILLRQLRGTKLWALNMLDATAKIPSGLLQGNGIQLGDFDQCLGSRARVQLDTGSVVRVQGQYCLARIDVKAEDSELEVPVHLAQAKNLIRSRIDDPGHFVPRFSTLSWGVCVPDSCDPEDVEVIIYDAIKHYQHKSGIVIRVKVDEQDCQTLDDEWEGWFELPTVLTLSFYAVIILLVLIATVQDFLARRKTEPDAESEPTVDEEKMEGVDQNEGKDDEKIEESNDKEDGVLRAFSLYCTTSKLLAPGTADEISCIHGVRALATLALLVAHKFLPVAAMPFTNRLKITEIVSSPFWSWSRAGWMYTDCFLLLSGTLTAHRISGNAVKRLLSRYLRLTPALLVMVLFYAYVWDLVASGPMWGTLVTKNAEICKEGWWWNVLYVQNYFGLEDMCAPQTHQLALDMQLTIFGGVIVWTLQSEIKFTGALLPVLHVLAAYSRYTTVQEHRLTMLAYHGVTVSQLYRTARLSYTSVLHRSTPYLVGISLGLALRNAKEHGKIVHLLGWLSSLTLWGLVWWAGLDSGSITYRYSAEFAAQYAAVAPLASALAIAWVVYAVHNGTSEGLLSRFLSCRLLVLISRLSYAIYLCQFVVFLTNAATVRSSSEFTITSLFDAQEISAILVTSTILTLIFITPMQSLHKIFTFSLKSENQEDSDETRSEAKKENPEQAEEGTEGALEKESEFTEENEEDVELTEAPHIKSKHHLIAHRELLEEIPEAEIEYEMQREINDGLEEILEEEEDAAEEEMENIDEEDLEIIEEEGGEDFWTDKEEYIPRRYSRDNDDWDGSINSSTSNGAQCYRYGR